MTDPLAMRVRRRLARPPAQVPDEPVLRWAAVAAILVPDPDALLIVRRAERRGDPWSGHLALPGGRRDPEDADLLFTAIRETAEEVGLELPPEHLLGVLDDVAPRTPVLPPVAVRPFVFALPRRAALRLSDEVAEAAWLDLAELLHPDRYGTVEVQAGTHRMAVMAYRSPVGTIWGMTERILRDLFA